MVAVKKCGVTNVDSVKESCLQSSNIFLSAVSGKGTMYFISKLLSDSSRA